MSVLGIVGSPRRNGRTNELIDAALKGAESRVQRVISKIEKEKGKKGVCRGCHQHNKSALLNTLHIY